MILAGDVGGTKVLLMLAEGGRSLAEGRYRSRDHGSLAEMVRAFLEAHPGAPPDRAAFGVAGPVEANRCRATNLPWDIDADRLGAALGIGKVRLLNDFEAIGRGLALLGPEDISVLNPPEPDPRGRVAILGAGTGLGEGFLVPCGTGWAFVPSEGGHGDFAPRNDKEVGFLRFMLRAHRRVSVERAVSGPGIANLFHYLMDAGGTPAEAVRREISGPDPDVPAVVSTHAADRSCPVCVEAMDMFWNLYGAEAGNLALKVLPSGGVYLAGGIVAKNLAALRAGPFMAAYGLKGRMSDLVREFPVRAILNQRVGLLGAALAAERE